MLQIPRVRTPLHMVVAWAALGLHSDCATSFTFRPLPGDDNLNAVFTERFPMLLKFLNNAFLT